MFIGRLHTSLNRSLALVTPHQTVTNRFCVTPGLLMLIKTLLTFQQSMTFVARHPRHVWTIGGRSTTLACIHTTMMVQIIVIIVSLLAL